MSVREFLRGGYNDDDGPVVVLNGGEVKGTWQPGTTGLVVEHQPVPVAAGAIPGFRPAPKPSAKKRGRA